MVHPDTVQWRYTCRSLHSTNPSGDAQPGALDIILTDLPRDLRQPSSNERKRNHQRRIADYVLFDYHKGMYCIVGEIKSDEMVGAESQNVEQMVDLFRKNQYAMLGFTCNPYSIVPRVLIQVEGTLKLYTLPTLSLNESYSD